MEPSLKQVILMQFPKPSRASSMEFDKISNTACSHPSIPSDPNITAGRFLTLSAPLSDEILSLSYVLINFFIILPHLM
jgi:hypothetical protein